MDDSLKVIEQAQDKRLRNADVKSAIEILQTLGDKIKDNPVLSYDYPNLLKNLGACYMDIGEIDQAREALEKALEGAKIDLNDIEMADIRVVRARLELQVATIEDAFYYANKAWSFIDGKKGDRFAPTRASTSEILGEIYYENENYTEAIYRFKFALEQAKKIAFTERELTSALNIVNYYITRGWIEDARELLDEYIEKAQEYKLIYANYQLSLAKILVEEGEAKEASKIALEVLKLAEKNGLLRLQAESSQTVGSTYAENNPAKADSYVRKAFNLYNEVGYNLPKKHPREEDWFNNFNDI